MDSLYNVTDAFTMVHPVTLSKGKNAHVWDTNGKRYIDFVGGIGVLNFGHCHPHIVDAIIDQSQNLIHYAYNAAGHLPYQKLMPRLCDLVPIAGELAGMLTNCGAEATENAIKIARMKTGRVGVIAFDGGFHAVPSQLSTSMVKLPRINAVLALLPAVSIIFHSQALTIISVTSKPLMLCCACSKSKLILVTSALSLQNRFKAKAVFN